VLDGAEWRKLLDSIPALTLRNLRDRALIATLTYSFARITAALKMKVEDLQPGSKTAGPPMPNPMVCHILEGEMRIDEDGKTFTAKKNFCCTCYGVRWQRVVKPSRCEPLSRARMSRRSTQTNRRAARGPPSVSTYKRIELTRPVAPDNCRQ
jgi:hypothetical protein